MKRAMAWYSLFMLPVFLLCLGCTSNALKAAPSNEVLTLSPVDQSKMPVTVRMEYNVNYSHMKAALEKKFPDTEFIFVLHCARDTTHELRQSLKSGDFEDIVISPNMKAADDIIPGALLDLSGQDLSSGYSGASINSCQIDGKLYYLPGPSDALGIIYDKTLFKEKGWEIPSSYDGFIALCSRIKAAGIKPVQATAKYVRQPQFIFTFFSYDECFGGVDNYNWIEDYQRGAVKMSGRLEPAFRRFKELKAAGIIEPEDFEMEPGGRSRLMYEKHACAMVFETQMAKIYAKNAGSDHEYGMMPVWCGNGPDSDHLLSLPNYYIGVNAGLAAKGSGEKLKKVLAVLGYMSTASGQAAVAGNELPMFSNVKAPDPSDGGFFKDIEATIKKGNLVPEVNLMASGNNNAAEIALRLALRDLLAGTMSEEEAMSAVDSARDGALARQAKPAAVLGRAAKNFSRLETGLFIADAFRKRTGADIALCLVGTTLRGEVGRIYRGSITDADIDALSLSVGKPMDVSNDKKLWVLSMKGSELIDFLSWPYRFPDKSDESPTAPYFVASGLNIQFRPWADVDSKLVSVKTEQGKALDPEKIYRVALWCWPFERPCPFGIEKVYEDSLGQMLAAAIDGAGGTISPDNAGRFSLLYQ